MDQICSWTFLAGPNFKDLLMWTNHLHGHFGQDQISTSHCFYPGRNREKKSRILGMLAVGYKANLDVARELPNLSKAKMFSCIQNVRDSFLENCALYSGQFTSIRFLFYVFIFSVLPGGSLRAGEIGPRGNDSVTHTYLPNGNLPHIVTCLPGLVNKRQQARQIFI